MWLLVHLNAIMQGGSARLAAKAYTRSTCAPQPGRGKSSSLLFYHCILDTQFGYLF